ncbi:MAG: C-GCAxxG-C-C family protein [Desulfarculaceae bacterium]|jgi:C_GCAxxG_C_C family probable redox protein
MLSLTQPLDKNLQNLVNQAVSAGEGGCSCSESILVTYGISLGLDNETAMKIASGFAGGMGQMGETCGAITAAFMVIGLVFGPASAQEVFKRQNSMLLVAEFGERFIQRRGSLLCRELCAGHTMGTPEGAKALRQSGLPARIIKDSAMILEDIIRENL